jgi:hypothetical protein
MAVNVRAGLPKPAINGCELFLALAKTEKDTRIAGQPASRIAGVIM